MKTPDTACALVVATCAALLAALQAAAQEEPQELRAREDAISKVTFVDHEGTVRAGRTAVDSAVHVHGRFEVSTADYFRGAFDNVRERAKDVSFRPSLALILEPWQDERGWRGSVGFTVGMAHGTSNRVTPVQDQDELGNWYEADFFGGATFRVLEDWLAGVTYTAYANPGVAALDREEIALQLVYEGEGTLGQLNLRAKGAVPTSDGDGAYLELSAAPTLYFFQQLPLPFELQPEVIAGYGSRDYYRDGSSRTGYLQFGLATSIPLGGPSPRVGAWHFDARGDLLVRDSDLRRLSSDVGESDTRVWIGSVGLWLLF